MSKHGWVRGLVSLPLLVVLACAPQPAAPSPAGQQPPSPQAPPAQPQPTNTPAAPPFSDLVKGAKQASYKIVYKVSGTSAGQSVSGEQTWYVKPPRSRIDISATAAGEAGSASMYQLEDGTYVCTAVTGQKTCFKSGREQAMQQNQGMQVEEQVRDKPDQVDAIYQGTRQIAGQQGQCYAVKPKAGAQAGFTEGIFCYSIQGFPLLMQSKDQGFEIAMEATSFSATVNDADLQLPAQAVEIPQIPGLPGGIPGVPGAPR